MKKPESRAYFAGVTCLVLVMAGNAAAESPKWLECTGQYVLSQVIDGQPKTSTFPNKAYYIFDDDSKTMSKYIEEMKTKAPEPVKTYTAQKIEWAVPSTGDKKTPYWSGQLDRASLALKVVITDPSRDEVITHTQQCKPTDPIVDATPPAAAKGK